MKKTYREEKIFKLRNLAQSFDAARKLFDTIELECGMILKDPNQAPICIVKHYNRLVRSSDLTLSERKELLIQEEK